MTRSHRRIERFVLRSAAFVLLVSSAGRAFGAQGLTFPPNGDNPQASVMQAIGPVRVTIDYSSPRVVRGDNDRRGKIWGELVPWGLSDLGLNGCKSCPWRAGANENTTFTTTHDVRIEGQPLPAGTYGLHMIPGQDAWTIIFSKDASSWGSFWYDPKNDALRVQTKAAKSEYHEWLTYEFTERDPAKATAVLKWEELQVPFHIAVDDVNALWVADIRRDLRQWSGFSWQNWQQAASSAPRTRSIFPRRWSGRSAPSRTRTSGGEENFVTLSTLSQAPVAERERAGGGEDARPRAEPSDGHRDPDPRRRPPAMMERARRTRRSTIFILNAKKHPDQWPVHVGLMRGYASVGDTKKALAEAKLALAQAPDPGKQEEPRGDHHEARGRPGDQLIGATGLLAPPSPAGRGSNARSCG